MILIVASVFVVSVVIVCAVIILADLYIRKIEQDGHDGL